MYPLIDFKNELQAECLNSALRRHGLNSFVFQNGLAPDGSPVYSITCFNVSELKLARHLLHTSHYFLADIHPEAAIPLRELRQANSERLLRAVTARPILKISALALAVALLGYVLGF